MSTSLNEETTYFIELARPYTHSRSVRYFIARFGMSPQATAACWALCIAPKLHWTSPPVHFSAKHFLWTLYFLKHAPSSWIEAAHAIETTDKTFKKYVDIGLDLIERSLPAVLMQFYLLLNLKLTLS